MRALLSVCVVLVVAMAAAYALALGTARANTTTYTVDTTQDTSGNNDCSLRDAINAANGTPTLGSSCTTAGSGNDTIQFSITGTIKLADPLPEITDARLTINGPAAPGITIDGQNNGIMSVASVATLNLRNLTIAHGGGFEIATEISGGGGIFNEGTLTVTNSTFSDNSTRDGIEGRGGGIDNEGKLTVTNSTFSGNTTIEQLGGGGGIFNDGTLTVTNSTFSGNSAFDGGGIYNVSEAGTVTITNSTFFGNSASNMGGGISNEGSATLKNTIVAGSTGNNCSGTISDAGYNISSDNSCGFRATTSHNNTNPQLNPAGLRNNGGPTQTIALLAVSPAIDAIPHASCTDQTGKQLTTDQRGFPRPDPGETICNIGAYEFRDLPAVTITVNSLADPVDLGKCTLHDAIMAANGMKAVSGCPAGSGNDTIQFSVTGTIKLASTLPTITDPQLTINGPASPGITIDGQNKVGVMQVASGATLNLNNLTIAHGFMAEGEGGGIFNFGTLTVTNSTFSGNSASVGGGISNSNVATLTITNSTFSGNSSSGDGGAIVNLGPLTITNSTFSANSARASGGYFGRGGAIRNDGPLIVTNSTFSANSARASGGAIFNFNLGTLTITNSTFSANSAGDIDLAGGIYNVPSGSATLKNTIIAGSTTPSGSPSLNCAGTITDKGYNISNDDFCGFRATTSHNNTNPQLNPAGLRNNGGPTQTIALLAVSPAIDAIPHASCTDQTGKQLTTDQRGFPRPDPRETICDIGAYELQDPHWAAGRD
jgi:CSLREA domain-containing protein